MPITLSVVLAAYVGIRFRHWDFDDAFIVYRYVANLRAGHGWAFNPGEDWNASTSVLNPILTLLTSFFFHSIPASAHIVGLVALVIGMAGLSIALLRQGQTLAALAVPPLGLLLPPLLLTWGLETQLFLGLVLVLLALEERGRSTWVLAGLLVLVRPDGALFLLFKTARHLWQHRTLPWRGLVAAGAVVTPWIMYSVIRFGSLLPSTLANKRGQGASGQWGDGSVYLRGLRAAFPPVFARPGLVAAVLALAVLGVAATVVRHQWWLGLLALFALTQQLAYCVLNPPYYHWYGVVALFTVCLFAVVGADFLVGLLPRWPRRLIGVAVIGIAFCGMAVHWLPRADARHGPREVAYREIADYVRLKYPDARGISSTEAGVIGYYVPLSMRVVDLIGLTSDNPQYYRGDGLDQFFARPPDLALFHTSPPDNVWEFESPVYHDPRFRQYYEFDHSFFRQGYTELSLFRLRNRAGG